MANIVDLQVSRPIMVIKRRNNAGCPSSEEHMGPHLPSCPLNQASGNNNSFDWNNLISSVGNSLTSIFGYLGSKTGGSNNNNNWYNPQQKGTNAVLWIGIVVVILIVGVVIFATRKK